jgi:hypothetical protein
MFVDIAIFDIGIEEQTEIMDELLHVEEISFKSFTVQGLRHLPK